MKIVAFDPGRIASYARLDTCRPFDIEIGEITLIGTGRLLRPCPLHIAEIIRDVDCCIVEEVGARTGQGVSAVFTFGLCAGTILGAVSAHGVPIELVSPRAWKSASRLGKLGDAEAKTASRHRAKEFWPRHAGTFDVKSNHGLAEAALMARWYFLAGPGRDVGIDMRAEENAAHEHGQSAKRQRKAA